MISINTCIGILLVYSIFGSSQRLLVFLVNPNIHMHVICTRLCTSYYTHFCTTYVRGNIFLCLLGTVYVTSRKYFFKIHVYVFDDNSAYVINNTVGSRLCHLRQYITTGDRDYTCQLINDLSIYFFFCFWVHQIPE